MEAPKTPIPDVSDEHHHYLLVLDGLVRRDGPATGLRGEVCIGLKGTTGYQWWRARFAPRFSTDFLTSRSTTAHATLFMAESVADAILQTGQVPRSPELLMIEGDRQLMLKFFKRYTSKTSWFEYVLGR